VQQIGADPFVIAINSNIRLLKMCSNSFSKNFKIFKKLFNFNY